LHSHVPDLNAPWSAERWAVDLGSREGVDLSRDAAAVAAAAPGARETLADPGDLVDLRDLDHEARVREAGERFDRRA